MSLYVLECFHQCDDFRKYNSETEINIKFFMLKEDLNIHIQCLLGPICGLHACGCILV